MTQESMVVKSEFHKNYVLEYGKEYLYKDYTDVTMKRGRFLRYDQCPVSRKQVCVFTNKYGSRKTVASAFLKLYPVLQVRVSNQFARGLCDRLPEDCVGLVERFLVGDNVVGKGPDRYPVR